MVNNDSLQLYIKCKHCGQTYNIRVHLNDLEAWQNGNKLVQNAFPYLKPEERELLLTKICPKCWNEMFGQYDF